MKENKGWVAIDLDGTLAIYDKWNGPEHIGEPVEAMVALVKAYLAKGIDVKIMTARVWGATQLNSLSSKEEIAAADLVQTTIVAWCEKHIGRALEVTCSKNYQMIAMYDDRCIQVEPNTGVALVEYYKDAADLMNESLEEIRKALGVAKQADIMAELRRLIK